MYGFYRVAAAVNKTVVANPEKNAIEILKLLAKANQEEVSVVTFPELSLTAYTASDLFLNQTLLENQYNALESLLVASKEISTVAILGFALQHQNRLYNTAVVIQYGKILGLVPKSYLPNKKEFYEKRQFNSGIAIKNQVITLFNQEIPFGVDLLFESGDELSFGVEICEDLWAVTPPSNQMAINGANIIFNLSASNELIGKKEYREELVRTQSARCMAAYVYASAGVGESSTDTLFGGHALICEYGSTLIENERFNLKSNLITADIDLQKLNYLRVNESSYCDTATTVYRSIKLEKITKPTKLKRFIPSTPFVPHGVHQKEERCQEIVNIQAHSLIKRMQHTKIEKAVIGISGGLDSTLALLSTHRAF
ncbi:MAG TPA: NAD(+) synthase, partial [Campylobacterales bacterium]|nr:NAD(+) synthase [Campylobacterales bacterium]